MVKKNIPLAACEKLLKQAGAPRVSDDAIVALQQKIENHAQTLGARAAQFARHAKRKTILKEDVELARK